MNRTCAFIKRTQHSNSIDYSIHSNAPSPTPSTILSVLLLYFLFNKGIISLFSIHSRTVKRNCAAINSIYFELGSRTGYALAHFRLSCLLCSGARNQTEKIKLQVLIQQLQMISLTTQKKKAKEIEHFIFEDIQNG